MKTILDGSRFWFTHGFALHPSGNARTPGSVEIVLVEGLEGEPGPFELAGRTFTGRTVRPDSRSRYVRLSFRSVAFLNIRPEWTDGASSHERPDTRGPVMMMHQSRFLEGLGAAPGQASFDTVLSGVVFHCRVVAEDYVYDVAADGPPTIELIKDPASRGH